MYTDTLAPANLAESCPIISDFESKFVKIMDKEVGTNLLQRFNNGSSGEASVGAALPSASRLHAGAWLCLQP
jgi:hypothetical protein